MSHFLCVIFKQSLHLTLTIILLFFRKQFSITICHTNILKTNDSNVFLVPFFSETSLLKTLKNLISFGEYNKTKKRKTTLFCFGSIIICTIFPKFFSQGKPQILPRPYYTSKPGHKGYNIICTCGCRHSFEK